MTTDSRYMKLYHRTKHGWLVSRYSAMKARSKFKNRPMPITKEELENFIFVLNKEKTDKIFSDWEKSGYKKNLSPSVNRLNNFLGYQIGNIEITTWEDNFKKSLTSQFVKTISHYPMAERNRFRLSRPVAQLNLQGEVIARYASTREAGRKTGYSQSGISSACRKEFPIYRKYVWNYE